MALELPSDLLLVAWWHLQFCFVHGLVCETLFYNLCYFVCSSPFQPNGVFCPRIVGEGRKWSWKSNTRPNMRQKSINNAFKNHLIAYVLWIAKWSINLYLLQGIDLADRIYMVMVVLVCVTWSFLVLTKCSSACAWQFLHPNFLNSGSRQRWMRL